MHLFYQYIARGGCLHTKIPKCLHREAAYKGQNSLLLIDSPLVLSNQFLKWVMENVCFQKNLKYCSKILCCRPGLSSSTQGLQYLKTSAPVHISQVFVKYVKIFKIISITFNKSIIIHLRLYESKNLYVHSIWLNISKTYANHIAI